MGVLFLIFWFIFIDVMCYMLTEMPEVLMVMVPVEVCYLLLYILYSNSDKEDK